MDGKFITFEGGEGAGKSTVLACVAEKLRALDYNVLTTREPGGIQISEAIRHIILDTNHTAMDAKTEALLYAAARRQHLVEKVQPALADGTIVLCDRFIDSSLAYQGYARGLGIDQIYTINQFAIDACMPSLTLWFKLAPEIGLKRIETNSEREQNRLDLETRTFHERVYKGYQILAERFSERIQPIRADLTIEEVTELALNKVISHINQ